MPAPTEGRAARSCSRGSHLLSPGTEVHFDVRLGMMRGRSRSCRASLRPASRQSQCAAGHCFENADLLDEIVMAPFSDPGRILMPNMFDEGPWSFPLVPRANTSSSHFISDALHRPSP